MNFVHFKFIILSYANQAIDSHFSCMVRVQFFFFIFSFNFFKILY
jgi:hypothetical protein